MASVEELIIKLTADNSDLKRKMADSEKSVGGLGGVVGKLGPMIAGAFAVGSIFAFSKAAFQASEQQTQANKRLLFAVKGNTVAFKDLTDQAEILRAATGVDDAAIMQIQNLSASTGRATSETKKITEAAVELAAVTGQDLQSAYMQINATYNGSAGRLTRLDAEFGNLTEAQLRNGEAVDLLLSKYKGFAANSATETQKLASNWDEFTEQIGNVTAPALNSFFAKVNADLAITTNSALTFWEKITMGREAAAALIKERQQIDENKKAWRDYDIKQSQVGFQNTAEGAAMVAEKLAKLRSESKFLNWNEQKVGIGNVKTELESYITSMEAAYRKAQELANFDVPVPTFGAMDAGVTTTTSKGITGKGGDPSKLQVRTQKEFGAAIKNTTSELQAQIGAMTQMNGIMTGFGEAAATAFGEQSMAAKAFAAGQVIAQAAVGIMGTWAGYAEFGPVGTALAVAQTAMIGGLAVTQLGKIAGAFAQGGIVGGSSFSGDRMTARVNSGEMILNGRQQQQLFAMANGGGGSQRIEIFGTLQGDAIRLSNKRSSTIAMKRGVR